MTTKHIKQPKGWFVLLWDDEYNPRHLCGKLVLKTPIECWAYDPSGEEPPIPYGYPVKSAWSKLNEEVCGVEGKPLVPLAFDAILAPSGEVIVVGKPPFPSVEGWLEAMGFPDDDIVLEIIDWPGTKAHPGALGPNTFHDAEVPF